MLKAQSQPHCVNRGRDGALKKFGKAWDWGGDVFVPASCQANRTRRRGRCVPSSEPSSGQASRGWKAPLTGSLERLPYVSCLSGSVCLAVHPFLEALLQDVHRQRSAIEHLIMKGADIKFLTELRRRVSAQFFEFQFANFVCQSLAW